MVILNQPITALLLVAAVLHLADSVTDKVITGWTKSTGYTGYNNYLTNVNKISYSSTYAYVYTNSIPSYTIGPTWTDNPNTPSALNYTFAFSRSPSAATTKTDTPLGHIGLWIDGVSIYNAYDGMSYNNLGVWERNAYYWEGVSFDSCYGHADSSQEYHIHVRPKCLYSESSSSHSPLIGFAFDNYPIYGSYGYTSANVSTSAIKRLKPSFALRSITERKSLANGTSLDEAYWGPTINTTYALGAYLQDYEYVSGSGDLDYYNGRWCVTPEFPSGTYAYFLATSDDALNLTYPYVIGPQFYGSVVASNMGVGSGSKTPTETVTVYYQYSNSSSSASAVGISCVHTILLLIPALVVSNHDAI